MNTFRRSVLVLPILLGCSSPDASRDTATTAEDEAALTATNAGAIELAAGDLTFTVSTTQYGARLSKVEVTVVRAGALVIWRDPNCVLLGARNGEALACAGFSLQQRGQAYSVALPESTVAPYLGIGDHQPRALTVTHRAGLDAFSIGAAIGSAAAASSDQSTSFGRADVAEWSLSSWRPSRLSLQVAFDGVPCTKSSSRWEVTLGDAAGPVAPQTELTDRITPVVGRIAAARCEFEPTL